jgi:hypothetical protein
MKEPKDKLEQWVEENRASLDYFEPDPALWQELQKKLDQEMPAKRKPLGIVRMYPMAMRAAAAVALLISAYFIVNYIAKPDSAKDDSVFTQVNLAEVSPELAEADVYYTREIQEKRKAFQALTSANPSLCKDFEKDIAQLDSMYTVLKKEIATTPDKDQVADAMIENLQIRIDILNQQLQILEKVKNVQTRKNNENKTVL